MSKKPRAEKIENVVKLGIRCKSSLAEERRVLVLPMIDLGKWGEVGTVVLILYKTTGEENGIKSRFEIE